MKIKDMDECFCDDTSAGCEGAIKSLRVTMKHMYVEQNSVTVKQ